MPCNGIAVQTAETVVDLEEHFVEKENRERLAAWLLEQGVPVGHWSQTPAGTWVLAMGNVSVSLRFSGRNIESRGARRYRKMLDAADWQTQLYAGQLAQVQILGAVQALGLTPQNLRQDANGGIAFTINAGITVKVEVDRLGRLELITQDGDFDTGKTALETLTKALSANGAQVEPVGEVETHNHEVMMQQTGQYTATVFVNQAVTESGPSHTH
jgi:hypothetical protein